MKKSTILVSLLLLSLAGGIGYAGYVTYLVTRQSVQDLGVRYTMDDYKKAVATKAGVDVPVPGDLYYGSRFMTEGAHTIEQTFSDAEISAIQNYSNEKAGPFRNVQIHFIGGNKIEASGLVLDPRVPSGPVYVKGDVIQTGPKSFSTKIDKLRVGDYIVPGAIIEKANAEFLNYTNGILGKIQGLNVERVEIQNGAVKFIGSVPDKAYAIR